MTPEELLKPRFKVIADYPVSPYPVGAIITPKDAEYFDKYPVIFKRLEWYEERKPEDMPLYLKDRIESFGEGHEVKYYKVTDNYTSIRFYRAMTDKGWIRMPDVLPATESEYLAFKNKTS